MRTLRQRTKSTSLVMSPAASSLVVKNGLRPLTLPLTMTGDRSALPQQPTCLTKLLLRAQSPKAFVSSASIATRFGVAVVAGAAVAVASRPQFGVSGSATGPVFPREGTCLQQDRGRSCMLRHLFTRSWDQSWPRREALIDVGVLSGIKAVSGTQIRGGDAKLQEISDFDSREICAVGRVKCVPRSTSTPAVNDALLSDACSLSRTRKGKLVNEATVHRVE